MEGIEESEARELQKADDEVRYRESSMRLVTNTIIFTLIVLIFMN